MSFAKAGEVACLEAWFPDGVAPKYVMEEEILGWKDDYPENKQYDGAAWPSVMDTDTTADAALMAELGQFFASGTKNEGELHVIALTHRHNGTAIIDDNAARKRTDSTTPRTQSVFMVSMIAAAAVSGLLADGEAWTLQVKIENTRDPRYAVIRASDKKEFEELLRFYRQIEKRLGWNTWPLCLHQHSKLLDAAAIHARKQDMKTLFAKTLASKSIEP
jgi:hypothetical protein